jgi:LPXTG-motif cell wall-anchored protein
MSPSTTRAGRPANDTRATDDSEGLARTGAGITAPLAFGAGMLALGGVIVFLIRRKRT